MGNNKIKNKKIHTFVTATGQKTTSVSYNKRQKLTK